MNGKFIVIEGLEGAGKTTARETVVTELRAYGVNNIVFSREPGGTPLAEKLRELVKQSADGERITDTTELLLMYAARSQLVENVIKPALARGAWVVGDRHDLSSQAYQGGGRGIDAQLLSLLRQLVLGDFAPDFTLYLDVPPVVGLQRVRQRGALDRIEQESLAFFERIRQRYLQLAQQNSDSIAIIDASQPLNKVTAEISHSLREWLTRQEVAT